MKKSQVKIGDQVFVLRTMSVTDMQIVRYTVKYKGKDKFIPEGFKNLKEDFQEIPYSSCYKSAEALVEDIIPVNVLLIEHNSGEYYDVLIA